MNLLLEPSLLWQKAGKNLNFEVVAPFRFRVEDREHECIAFLPDFGGQNGMVLFISREVSDEVLVNCIEKYIAVSQKMHKECEVFNIPFLDTGTLSHEQALQKALTLMR